MHRRGFLAAAVCGVTAALAGCTGDGEREDDPAMIHDETLTLTTSTSTYVTGLINTLNTAFERRYGIAVNAVAQGTGAAIRTARNGDSDLIVVHARSLEDDFIQDGYGINRRDLMYNDFIIVGPDDDPAGIDTVTQAPDAFHAIADTGSIFVSRGDTSGTHTKELAIWDAADTQPRGEWYRDAGSGMGATLFQADQSDAYTLTDRATFISMQSELRLGIRLERPTEAGSGLLANPYGIVAVNPGMHENANYDLAMSYIGFATSRTGQQIIENHTINGKPLFYPTAITEDPNFHQYVPEGWAPEEEA